MDIDYNNGNKEKADNFTPVAPVRKARTEINSSSIDHDCVDLDPAALTIKNLHLNAITIA